MNGISTAKSPRPGAPSLAVTVSSKSFEPSGPSRRTRSVASKTLAVPLTAIGLVTVSPNAGCSIRISGVNSGWVARVIGRACEPTGSPWTATQTRRMVGNCVSV